MHKTPIWKPILILVVLALSVYNLWPPQTQLKQGLDLAGGTTLIYEVDVPAGADPRDAIDQVIEVLRYRVDPNGVRNLNWRQQAGNRIEIEMPLASPRAAELRDRYIALLDELDQDNLSAHVLDATLRVDKDARDAQLQTLAGGSELRLTRMREAAKAYDAMTAAQVPYSAAQDAFREAQAALDALPDDAPEDRRSELQAQRDRLLADLVEKTEAFSAAQATYEQARQAVLATNLDATEVKAALDLPLEVQDRNDETGERITRHPRQDAIDRLLEQYPDRAPLIQSIVDVHAEYSAVRGPLDDPNDLIMMLRGSGVLEFRIAQRAGAVPDLAEYVEQLQERGPASGPNKPFRWFVVDDPMSWADTRELRAAIEADPVAYFRDRMGLIAAEHAGQVYLLLGNTEQTALLQTQEWQLADAYRAVDSYGFPAVGFRTDTLGAQLMAQLTANHINQPMAIVLDGRVMSAPNIQDKISGSGIINGGAGGFGQQELDYLLRTLNAGSLQARLSDAPLSIKTTGPRAGADNLQQGLNAALWSLILVGGFMIAYYLFWGVVADLALVANLLIILGVMATLQATFTLPGIAGIILTIGMAVDANVLIFERIREEQEAGRKLDAAIREGFSKAFVTILDANITTLITCLVLGYTATAEVKGFAVTLGIGICATLFTALFCTRVLVDLYVQWFKPKALPMTPSLVPAIRRILSPNVNWVRMAPACCVFSVVLCVLCIGAVVVRGESILDIEFRSGTQVGFELADGKRMPIGEVRERLAAQAASPGGLEKLADAQVVTVGSAVDGAYGAFSVSVIHEDADEVSDQIKEAFGDLLGVSRPIDFKGVDASTLAQAPVFRISDPSLGANINRPEITLDAGEFLGGVAVVLDEMDPPATVDDIRQRIQRMRLQPTYENLGVRRFEVIGLDLAQVAGDQPASGAPLYRTAVVLVADRNINYIDQPDTFLDQGGLADTEWHLVHDALQRDTSLASVANFSGQVSRTMQISAAVALSLSLLAICIYIWIRFGNLTYGMAAILALAHDVALALGLVAASAWVADTWLGNLFMLDAFRIDLAMVAAILTIVGYSINDTIIVFDRIREVRGKQRELTGQMINDGINQTISRTALTSGTTLIAILLLYIIGGPGVHGFAFAMLIGVVTGTYSSVAIAAPMLTLRKRRSEGDGGDAEAPSA